MRLSQLLETLTSTGIQLTLVDLETNAEIVDMKVSGYPALDDTIEAREVKQWFILSATHIKVVIGAAVEEEPETNEEPQNP